MKKLYGITCALYSLLIISNAKTIVKDINNNEPNEIPREPFKPPQGSPRPLQSRQNVPNTNNTVNPQVIATAANIQNLLSTSPIVQALLSNQTVQNVLSDPIVQNVLRNPTVQNVLGNRIMQNILFDPALQGFAMQSFLSSFTTTTTSPLTRPTSTPTPPVFQIQNIPPPRPPQASQQNNIQPQQSNFQPQQSNFQPQQTNFQPQQTNFQPEQSNFQPQQSNFQPQQFNSQQQPNFQTQQSNFQSTIMRPINGNFGPIIENRPTLQQAIMTAVLLGIDELINILQTELNNRNRNTIINSNRVPQRN